MRRIAMAIIGANWGDEGKGLAVDALAARLAGAGTDVTVVRSNGGAQAGHGVRRPDGAHHVFHHVGAGTFAGAATHLSQFFVAHPMMLADEIAMLDAAGHAPRRITIDPRAAVTTPWDMAINQALELSRKAGRHGSTGLGFGETLERTEAGVALSAKHLWQPDLPARLDRIARQWVPMRLTALSLDPASTDLAEVFADTATLTDRYLDDCAAFRARVSLAGDAALRDTGTVLFEGAQGLQLDMDLGAFPHVTRSRTGLCNMAAIAAEAGIDRIDATYMTRAYATRHGAGPLPHETSRGIGWADGVDLTNAPNPWQGTIRKAVLDAGLLSKTIARDLARAGHHGAQIRASLGVTCLDQVTGAARLMLDGCEKDIVPTAVPAALSRATGLPIGMTSHGPERTDVRLSVATPA